MIVLAAKATAVFVLLVLAAYALRHSLFVLHRLFVRPKTDYTDLVGFYMPSISVLIPMHNEEAVAPDVLEALLGADYPHDPNHFEILPINDHSTDQTRAILDEYARRHACIKPLHRKGGNEGKQRPWKREPRWPAARF